MLKMVMINKLLNIFNLFYRNTKCNSVYGFLFCKNKLPSEKKLDVTLANNRMYSNSIKYKQYL